MENEVGLVFCLVFTKNIAYFSNQKRQQKTRNPLIQRAPGSGADSQIRTGDLILTKQPGTKPDDFPFCHQDKR